MYLQAFVPQMPAQPQLFPRPVAQQAHMNSQNDWQEPFSASDDDDMHGYNQLQQDQEPADELQQKRTQRKAAIDGWGKRGAFPIAPRVPGELQQQSIDF